MIVLKLLFIVCSLYLCDQIIHSEYFSVVDNKWDIVTCNSIEDGYEYRNIVVDKPGVRQNDPPIECWFNCYMGEGCIVKLEQPRTYGYLSRFIVAIIVLIDGLILM